MCPRSCSTTLKEPSKAAMSLTKSDQVTRARIAFSSDGTSRPPLSCVAPHREQFEGFLQFGSGGLASADSVDSTPVNTKAPCEFSSRQVIQARHHFSMEVITLWVVVFGDDFV